MGARVVALSESGVLSVAFRSPFQFRLVCFTLVATLACDHGSVGDHRSSDQLPSESIAIARVGGTLIGAIEVDRPFLAQSSGRGSFYLARRLSDDLLLEVDSASGEIIRTIGAIGNGPGEYRATRMILAKADSLLVQDPLDGSIQVYGPDGGYVRSISAEVAVQAGSALLLRADTIVVAEPISKPESFGLPLHLLTPGWALVKSFGSDDRTIAPGYLTPRLRVLAPHTDSSLWVARRDRYQIELWNTAGVRERVIQPERDWFPPMTQDPGDPTLEPPSSMLEGISQDAHGHLIVVLHRAARDWKPTPGGEAGGVDLFTRLAQFEVVIEVLDPDTGELLAHHVPAGLITIGGFMQNGLLVGLSPTAEEIPTFAFFRITHTQ